MISNAQRLAALGKLAKNINQLSLYNPNPLGIYPLIDDTAHTKIFNYSLLLWQNSTAMTYKDYLIADSKIKLEELRDDELYIWNNINIMAQNYADMVETPTMTLDYSSSNNSLTYVMSEQNAIFTVVDQVYTLIDEVEKGNVILESDFAVAFLLRNILGVIVDTNKYARDAILDDCGRLLNLLNSISLGLLLAMMSILVIFLVVLFPFLSLVNSKMGETLQLLTQIHKKDIRDQIGYVIAFMRKIRMRQNDGNQELNEVGENNLEIDIQDADEDDENKEKTETHSESLGETTKRASKIPFIPHSNNSWQVLVFTTLFSGIILGIYVGYDSTAKQLGNLILVLTNELYLITRSPQYNAYVQAYYLNYVYSNKTGNCSLQPCQTYIPVRALQRLQEFNNLIAFHSGNESLMSDQYDSLFANIMENAPCESIAHFSNISACQTFLGGIFNQGANIASIQFINILLSAFYDFSISSGNASNIKSFLNDDRIIKLEILDELFLSPSFAILQQQLLKDENSSATTNNIIACIVFILFVTVLFVVSGFGGRWLLNYMRRSIFDTKAIFSSLPSDIIYSNEGISKFLLDSKEKDSESSLVLN